MREREEGRRDESERERESAQRHGETLEIARRQGAIGMKEKRKESSHRGREEKERVVICARTLGCKNARTLYMSRLGS